MIRTFFLSLKIDYFSAINSFLYSFQKVKFLDKILHPLYKKTGFKIFLSFLSSILTLFSSILTEAIYLFVIYKMSQYLSKENLFPTFLHIYVIFAMIGMFIHTNLLEIGSKHYMNICLLSMNAKDYLLSHLLYNNILHFFIHSILLYYFIGSLNENLLFCFLLPAISVFSKIIGEMINLKYYAKTKIRIPENYVLYFSIVITLLAVTFLPYFSIFIPSNFYPFITIFLFLFFIYSLFYLFTYQNYLCIVKEILRTRVLSKSTNFQTKDLVEVKDKQKEITTDKLKNKKGYDLIHTIFFERHKNILLNSSIKISVFLMILGMIGIFYFQKNQDMVKNVSFFFKKDLGTLILFLYFINRGGMITQAMFMNCDHALLRYNFYRNSEVITGMYQKRLKTVTLINLLPAFVIGILLVLYGYLFTNYSVVSFLFLFLTSLILSMFFSIFYLMTYYLFQPYNSEFRMVRFSYSFCHFITFLVCLILIRIPISAEFLFLSTSIVTLLFYLLSNYFIKNKSSYTFRIQ